MAGLVVLLLLLFSFVSPALSQTPLTLIERIQAQEKIERVYYNHRIWPNTSLKPSFEELVPRGAIEQKAIDSIKKSEALQTFWKRSITPEMLQQEMDRIAKTTKDPEMLQELFRRLTMILY